MVRWAFAAISLPVLLACSSPDEVGDEIAAGQGESAQAALDRRLGEGAEPVEFKDEEARGEAARDFAYLWPAQVSAIEPFAAMLTQERDKALADQKAEWEQSVAEFADAEDGYQCITCVNRYYSKSWTVAADTPRFLVMLGTTEVYTGGAHGNTDFDALMWDREANDGAGAAMRPVALFVDEVALENTAYGDYCQSLLEARRDKLEIDITAMNKFDNCPSVSELVVLPLASDGKRFDTIRFVAAPYVAGSYAEGPYEFEIAVNDLILSVVKPEYRGAFALAE